MNKKYKFNLRFEYPNLESDTSETGRVYYTPAGPSNSVTTILGSLPNPGLDAWRERVGDDEAKRVSTEATTIGTHMHNLLENHLLDEDYPIDTTEYHQRMALGMFNILKMLALRRVGEIWGVEVALHCENLWAGRTDLVGLYDGLPSIIDYKTSKYFKPDEFVEKYKLQLALYSIAHEYMFPEQKIRQGVLLIGIRPNEKYKQPAKIQIMKFSDDELLEQQLKALEIIVNYYEADTTRHEAIGRLLDSRNI